MPPPTHNTPSIISPSLFPPLAGRVLVVTLKTADLGRARFSVTPFGGAIPGYENAHRPELAKALTTPAGERSADQVREIAAAFIHGTTPEEKLPAAYARLRDAILECRAGYAHSMVAEAVARGQDRRRPLSCRAATG